MHLLHQATSCLFSRMLLWHFLEMRWKRNDLMPIYDSIVCSCLCSSPKVANQVLSLKERGEPKMTLKLRLIRKGKARPHIIAVYALYWFKMWRDKASPGQ